MVIAMSTSYYPFLLEHKMYGYEYFLHFLLKENSFLHLLNDIISHNTKHLFFKLQYNSPTKQ